MLPSARSQQEKLERAEVARELRKLADEIESCSSHIASVSISRPLPPPGSTVIEYSITVRAFTSS